MTPAPGGIRTPDQRLRVFVSSTLKELAPERALARRAIERLHLAPVMFELGARPHPPRELYRSYLRQSDVFVGLYAERYGWVAPGESVSGLEDEYNLAGSLPKLIYIKDPAPAREPRLTELLNRVRVIDVGSIDAISFRLTGGARVTWGSADESAAKARVLAVLLQQRASAYDVTAPGRPTLRPLAD